MSDSFDFWPWAKQPSTSLATDPLSNALSATPDTPDTPPFQPTSTNRESRSHDSNLSKLTSDLRKKSKETQHLRAVVEELERTVDVATLQCAELDSRVGSMELKLERIGDDVESMHDIVVENSGKVGDLVVRVDGAEADIGGVRARIEDVAEGVEKKWRSLETTLWKVEDEANDMEGKVEKQFADLGARMDATVHRVSKLEQGDFLAELKKIVLNNESRISGTETYVDRTDKRISELETEMVRRFHEVETKVKSNEDGVNNAELMQDLLEREMEAKITALGNRHDAEFVSLRNELESLVEGLRKKIGEDKKCADDECGREKNDLKRKWDEMDKWKAEVMREVDEQRSGKRIKQAGGSGWKDMVGGAVAGIFGLVGVLAAIGTE
ncbi:hypothetical protein BJ742DRAFT_823017 [Cladochytrium replicatum]|nr:hypothetical protein BJ742DRAFT_823017 [Cladochytrium replicatum]